MDLMVGGNWELGISLNETIHRLLLGYWEWLIEDDYRKLMTFVEPSFSNEYLVVTEISSTLQVNVGCHVPKQLIAHKSGSLAILLLYLFFSKQQQLINEYQILEALRRK